MSYSKEVKEFITVRVEQTPNDTQIARDVYNKFGLDKKIDAIRVYVKSFRENLKIKAKAKPIKRLFFDIETSYYVLKLRVWQLKNYTKYFNPETIESEKEIICISYKWQGEDEVHTLDWRNGEKEMLKAFIKVMGEADECIGHNGDRFDIRFIRTRCFYHGVLMFPNYRTLDTLKKSRSGFSFASNKLDYLGKFAKIGGKLEHEGFKLWTDVIEGDDNTKEIAINKMIKYCERDVIVLEDFYFVLSPFITSNNHFAVLKGGEKYDCPECCSKDVRLHHTYTTAMGIIRREMACDDCKKQYKVSNKTYMNMLVDARQ